MSAAGDVAELLVRKAEAAGLRAENEALRGHIRQLVSERRSNNALAAAEAALITVRGLRVAYQERAEAAEARVKVLEGDAVPAFWALKRPDGHVVTIFSDKARVECVARDYDDGTVDPLYRHPPKPAGEPVAWLVRFVHRGDDGATVCAMEGTADKLADLYSGKKTPLYEAPPPAALGVEGERFAVLASSHALNRPSFMVEFESWREVGTLAEATEKSKTWTGMMDTTTTVVRIVPADAPVVDVAAIRRVVAFMDAAGNQGGLATSLRAAIGEAK